MTSNGIVVDHKDSNVRYAISEANFDERFHVKVRDLKQHETVRGYKPKPRPEAKPEAEQAPEGEQPETPETTETPALSEGGDGTPTLDGFPDETPDQDPATAGAPDSE
jgi:hypothetical protein